jgi:anthraniloyl-CoA monooxygenase
MKINVLGGGPGGLYSAILLKQARPKTEVRVWEQNPADATYGFGVVFSDQTLEALREADAPTHKAITDRFARWDAIDVHYRGHVLRSHGQAFAGIERKELLSILQERCRELGVTLEFERRLDGIAEALDADFVVAADGLNSIARAAYADVFQPRLDVRPWKYVWLGTTYRPEAFTFIFQETEFGLFLGTIYPYADDRSTLVVECDPVTWRRAGLEEVTEEETVAFCHEIFSEHLGDSEIFNNKSLWISFTTVRNRVWHHDRIVLLGDAAHTAHFSIGSGTKLAMEDAVALAQALERKPDLKAALVYYEQDRRPVVERIQEAARESYTWFENIRRYTQLDPIPFTFNLLVRSGRITYDNLRVRDRRFVAVVDRWFASGGDATTPRVIATPPMFVPLRLREMEIENRAVLETTGAGGGAEDGAPGERQRRSLTRRAAAGAGLVLTEHVAVSHRGRITANDPCLYAPEHAEAWRRILDPLRTATRTRVGVRLNHAGSRGATRPPDRGLDRPLDDGWDLLAASAIPYGPRSRTPQEMDRADMETVVAEFRTATDLADAAGFDLIVLTMSHGYLLSGFISPLTNQRSDEWGGELADRLRFPLEVFAAVRSAWPDEKPIAVSLTATDWAVGGLGAADSVEIAVALKDLGCDLIDVHAGHTIPRMRPAYGRLFLAPYSDRIRNEARIPTMVGGGLRSSDDANTLLAARRVDLCILDPLDADRELLYEAGSSGSSS